MNSAATRLLAALAYPRALDDYLELALPLHSTREIRARVLAVRRETHDVSTLVLRPSARLRPHRAGQHVALGAVVDGVRRTRVFSIASGEPRGERLEITVKARAGGAVTPRLVRGELGSPIVTLSQPAGDFVLPDAVPERVLLLGAGSGITPVMSMLRTLRARGHGGDLVFVHFARSERDAIFASELARLGARVCTEARGAEALESLVPDFDAYETWACGPAPFLEGVTRAFAARGAASRVRVERFSPSRAAAGEGEVRFARSERGARGRGTLLALAEGAGLSPPSGCRMGICRTCVCRKVSGKTRDLRTGEIETDDDVDVALCVSEAVGPVVLDL